MDAVLGLDCGQTSTKACLVALDGALVARGRGGAVAPLLSPAGFARSERSVREALAGLKAALGDRPVCVRAAVVGFSGILREFEETVAGWVRGHFPADRVAVLGDAPVNLAGEPEPPARTVVVIAGGGSVAWAVGADGAEVVSGGWGHTFGDEGSGWWLGRSAVTAALRAIDGRGPATLLTNAVAAYFGVDDPGAVKHRYNAGAITDSDLAGLVPRIVAVAADGDAVARDLLAAAGRELGLAAAAVIRRAGWTHETPTVLATGGVFAAGPLLWDPFARTVREVAPSAAVRRPRFEPVVGAALLALRQLDVDLTPALLDRLEKSLEVFHP